MIVMDASSYILSTSNVDDDEHEAMNHRSKHDVINNKHII
jgi:hypothetical protein